jgi:hypothetical protein
MLTYKSFKVLSISFLNPLKYLSYLAVQPVLFDAFFMLTPIKIYYNYNEELLRVHLNLKGKNSVIE